MRKRGRPRHPEVLTPREQEVQALLREGLSNEVIAERLGITVSGVKYHVSEIISKLHVRDRHEAAAWNPHEDRPSAVPAIPAFRRGLSTAMQLAAAAAILAAAVATGALLWGVTRTEGEQDDRRVVAESWTIRDDGASTANPMVFDLESREARRVNLGTTKGFLQWVDSDDLLAGYDANTSGYRTVRLDGTVVRSLMSQPEGRLNQWFVPQYDGRHLLFHGMDGQLVRVDAMTGDKLTVDHMGGGVATDGQYSRGGTIAYTTYKEDFIDKDGNPHDEDVRRLVFGDGGVFAEEYGDDMDLELAPNAWSPDGTKVLLWRQALGWGCNGSSSCREFVGDREYRVYGMGATNSFSWTSADTPVVDAQWAGSDRLFVKRYDTEPGGCLCLISEFVDLFTGKRTRAPSQLDSLGLSFSPDGRYAVALVGTMGRVDCNGPSDCRAPEWDAGCALIDTATGSEIVRIDGTQADIGTAFCAIASWTADGTKAIASQGGN